MKDRDRISDPETSRVARLQRTLSHTLSRAAIALTLVLGANAAQAGIIIGDSVDVAVHAPTLGEICFLCGGVTQVTVSDDASDTIEPYLAGGGWFDVDVNSTSISISFTRDISWQTDDFIGLVISDIDWLDGAMRVIPGVQLETSLLSINQVNSRLQHTDTSVSFNWQGMTIPAGTRFEISLAAVQLQRPPPGTNVAEPGTLFLLFGFGLLLLCRNVAFPRYFYFRTE